MRDNIQKKKILIIHHGEGLGGGLTALLGLVEELKIHYSIKILVIFNSSAIDYLQSMGVEVLVPKSQFYLRFYRLFLHSEATYFTLSNFVRTIKNIITFFFSKYYFAKKELEQISWEYDIVYHNSVFISDWARAAKLLNKRTIIHVREPLAKGLFGFRKAVIRCTIRKYCDKIIAISNDNAKRLSIKDVHVVYDPVIHAEISENMIDYNKSKYKYFIYLGGSQRIKGFEQFVLSLEYLNDNIRVFFLGGSSLHSKNRLDKLFSFLDPYLKKLPDLINTLEKSNKIINVGLVKNTTTYYYNSSALISPFSKPHASLPILEAFSLGKPVIVSNIPGMDELVDEKNGFTFEDNHPRDLAQSINRLASLPPEHYEKMSQAAKYTYIKIRENNDDVIRILSTFNYP